MSYDEGLDVGYRWYDATGQRPLFPFGYGLSYEHFAVSGVHAAYDPHGGATMTATVTNLIAVRPGHAGAVPAVAMRPLGTAQAAQGVQQRGPRAGRASSCCSA